MSTSDLQLSILSFLNSAFEEKKVKLEKIEEVRNAEILDRVLNTVEPKFFANLSLLPPDETENTLKYNLSIIYQRIFSFYSYVIKSQIEESYFDANSFEVENCIKLAKLIVGICAQSKDREKYIEIMSSLGEKQSNDLMNVLIELIPVEECDNEKNNEFLAQIDSLKEKLKEKEGELEEKENENAMLWIRVENAEKEVERMSTEETELSNKVTELTRMNYIYELNNKELDSKYQELVSSLENRENAKSRICDNCSENSLGESAKRNEIKDTISLNIVISELKGKLEAKTKSFFDFQEEKEKVIDELKNDIIELKKENRTLKESNVKLEVLQSQFNKFSIDDFYSLKQRLSESEREVKKLQEENQRIKFSESQKKFLERIKDLNTKLAIEEEKNEEKEKEIESLKQQLILKECELTQLLQERPAEDNGNALENLIRGNGAEKKKEEKKKEEEKIKINDLETKLQVMQSKYENLKRNNIELNQKVEVCNEEIEKKNQEVKNLEIKLEKLKKTNEENQTFIKKITELMEKVSIFSNENLILKQEILDNKNKYNEEKNEYERKINEQELIIRKLEEEIEKNNDENKNIKYNELVQINENLKNIERRASLPNSTKLDEMANILNDKLKNLNDTVDLKSELKEKDHRIKTLTSQLSAIQKNISEMEIKISHFPAVISEKLEMIEYYKKKVAENEKMHSQELQVLSRLFHKLKFEWTSLKKEKKNKNANKKNYG